MCSKKILKRSPEIEEASTMANEVGKRYRCTKCGSEFIVTKAGSGTINCCKQPMEQKK
jgi:desulfoferrodoxin-like iron-binding protein